MSPFESSILALIAPAAALAAVALIATAVLLRRPIARDWRTLTLKIDEPIALAFFTLAAAFLRIAYLGRPMGSDESATFLYYASKPLLVAMTVYGSPNNHLLHTALMHGSYRLFGEAEWALRLPALVAGIAMIPLTYIASRAIARSAGSQPAVEPPERRLHVAGGALLASAMAAAFPVLIDYSTDARGYTLLCCFVLICAAAMAEIRRSGNAAASAIFAISAALGFFTIPVMVYPFTLLLVWGRRRAIIPAAAAIAIAALLYMPALMVSGFASVTQNPYVRPLPIDTFMRGLLQYVAMVRRHLFVAVPLAVQILIAVGFIVAILSRELALLWAGFAAVIVLVAAQRVLPFPRVWLPFLVLMLITAAAAWRWPGWSERFVAIAMATVLAMSAITVSRPRETGELSAVHQITRELRLRAHPGDPVLALPPSEMPLAFYLTRQRIPVEVLLPDLERPRLFLVENRDYGQSLARTLAYFRLDPRRFRVVPVRDFGSSVLYELVRFQP